MFTCNFLPLRPCGLRLNKRFIWTGTRANNIQGPRGRPRPRATAPLFKFRIVFHHRGFVIGAGGWSKSLPRRLSEVSHLPPSMTNFTLQMSRLNRRVFTPTSFFFLSVFFFLCGASGVYSSFQFAERKTTSGFFGRLPPATTRSHSLQRSCESEWFVPLCRWKRN